MRFKNTVMHRPNEIAGSIGANTLHTVIVLAKTSIDAGDSIGSNYAGADRDRVVDPGNHIGQINLDLVVRGTVGAGVLEIAIIKVERHGTTPAVGTFPIPSTADLSTVGLAQQIANENPGRVMYTGLLPFTAETTRSKHISVSPMKYKKSKMRAGDYICMLLYNRTGVSTTFDWHGRYKALS